MRDITSYEMNCSFNVEITMRDGVILRGDLYKPSEEGAYPVLLLRTVFRKEYFGRSFGQYDPSVFVKHGYSVFIQDVRGLGQSDGDFDRFSADGADGYDTIEWLAAQAFCNGKVGMIGNYYAGYLQLMAAAENPPHLRAICPMQTSVSINRDCNNRGFLFSSHIGWNMSRLCNRLLDNRYDKSTTQKWLPLFQQWLTDYPYSQLSVWPACDMPAIKDTPFPQLKSYFQHLVEGYDDFDLLHKEGRDMDLRSVCVPAFYVCGWYDSSRTPLLDHCITQRSIGVDSRILIAPWKQGELPVAADSALESGAHTIDLQAEMIAWFDHWMKDYPVPDTQPIRYYDIVTNQPVVGTNWPPCKSEDYHFYLGENNSLSITLAGAGKGYNEYEHNPIDPLIYQGYGATHHSTKHDKRVIEYISPSIEESLHITGLPVLDVWLESTARDADVMAILVDFDLHGNYFIICDGATRARYRDDWTSKPLKLDEIVHIQVLLGNVCYTLKAGHRLLLQISGSAFPKYDTNHGTAHRPANDSEWIKSTQRIWYGDTFASHLTLPIS